MIQKNKEINRIDNIIKELNILPEDIQGLIKSDVNDILSITTSESVLQNKKNNMLIEIYFNPYILYGSSILTENIMDDFCKFVIDRYNQETEELDYMLEESYISSKECSLYKYNIDRKYFDISTVYGRNIKRMFDKNSLQKVKTI